MQLCPPICEPTKSFPVSSKNPCRHRDTDPEEPWTSGRRLEGGSAHSWHAGVEDPAHSVVLQREHAEGQEKRAHWVGGERWRNRGRRGHRRAGSVKERPRPPGSCPGRGGLGDLLEPLETKVEAGPQAVDSGVGQPSPRSRTPGRAEQPRSPDRALSNMHSELAGLWAAAESCKIRARTGDAFGFCFIFAVIHFSLFDRGICSKGLGKHQDRAEALEWTDYPFLMFCWRRDRERRRTQAKGKSCAGGVWGWLAVRTFFTFRARLYMERRASGERRVTGRSRDVTVGVRAPLELQEDPSGM